MPYTWFSKALSNLYFFCVLFGTCTLLWGLMFLQLYTILIGTLIMTSSLIIMLFDKLEKIENIIENAVKKAKK